MRSLLTTLTFLIGFSLYGTAQDQPLDGSKREKLEALKVAYITEKLDLSPSEAQVFWPIYNELQDKLKEVKRERRSNRRHVKENHQTMTDKELDQALEVSLDLHQKELDLTRTYTDMLKKEIPVRKVVTLYALEEAFKKRLLKQAKEKGRQGRSRP